MRYTRKSSDDSATSSCLALLIVCFLFAFIGAFCWPYTINAWLAYCGKSGGITWWQGALLGFVPYLGRFSIPAAVLTWILMFFL